MKSNSRTMVGLVGMGLVAFAAMSGCATDNAAGPLSASLSSPEYARIAEAQCTGLPTKEQQMGVLAYRDSIAGTQTLKEEYSVGKMKLTHDRGVQLAIRAQPSMSVPWLERVATCHMALARSNALANSNGDPQLVAGATVRVEETFTGYVVSIRVPDADSAAEVMRRTTVAMTATSGPMTAEHITH
jgi:hypothetical protein